MYQVLLPALFFLFSPFLEDPNSNDLVRQAQAELQNYDGLRYTITGMYPNPMGSYDTLVSQVEFQKNGASLMNYDFVLNGKESDNVYVDGILKTVNHANENVEIYPSNKVAFFIEHNRFIQYSPLTLLEKSDWNFIAKKSHAEFYRVESDTVVNGNKIYTEVHIYINPNNKLLERIERHNYFKGELAQNVIFELNDYVLQASTEHLVYDFPSDYNSIIYGKNKNSAMLEIGKPAPFFTGVDLNNNPINLLDYKGKKILLDFSTVNCGYCRLALNHFNRDDFQLSDDIEAFYVNPEDNAAYMEKYLEKVKIPFPILPDAEEIGKLYGVSGYPTFVLIDEKGIIEEVVLGYDEEFIEGLGE